MISDSSAAQSKRHSFHFNYTGDMWQLFPCRQEGPHLNVNEAEICQKYRFRCGATARPTLKIFTHLSIHELIVLLLQFVTLFLLRRGGGGSGEIYIFYFNQTVPDNVLLNSSYFLLFCRKYETASLPTNILFIVPPNHNYFYYTN